ncbi:MAG TPA: methyltransferase domain-containing protein [Gaiellaceae bacterium]|nr:methyltransferase domain-containing protein [Gaiellaceae bacterium]
MSGEVLDGAGLGADDDVLVLGGTPPLVFGAHGRIGDGWVYAVDEHVDALEGLLAEAHRQGVAGIAYLVGDPAVLPLPDGSVAAAVGASLAGGRDPEVVARELHRVLRPGGRISVEAGDDDAAAALAAAGFAEVTRHDEGGSARLTARRP